MKTTSPVRQRGYTLVEIIVATTLFAIVTVGIMSVFLQALNTYAYDTGKIFVNKDIRRFTTEMTENATFANFFLLFPNYTSISRVDDTLVDPMDPDQGFTTAIVDNSLQDGQSGDCLVLVYKDSEDDRKISSLVIYFRSPTNPADPNSTGPVRRLQVNISPSSLLPVWQLIPEIADPALHPEVVELSRGLANGRLFYNFYSRSIIVKGEILHRGSLTRQATNTYNFTVSPRG